MSYSYTDLLSSIFNAHAEKSPQSALEHYATLSEHCSMTPLLWIQYAIDSTSVDPSHSLAKEVIQLALDEFPGCILLWMYYLDISFHCTGAQDDDDDDDGNGNGNAANTTNDCWEIWCNAMNATKGIQTCLPSQPNLMLAFYNLGIKCFPRKAREIYIQRANSLLCGNETIASEMAMHTDLVSVTVTLPFEAVEEGRKFVSQNMGILNQFEEDVAVAMAADGIVLPTSFSFQNYYCTDVDVDAEMNTSTNKETTTSTSTSTCMYNWKGIVDALGGIQGQILMGYGMVTTSSAFLSYVQGLLQHVKYLQRQAHRLIKTNTGDKGETKSKGKTNSKEGEETNEEELKGVKELIQLFTNLIVPTYERAISECPTVEIVWVKYLRHLLYVLHNDSEDFDSISVTGSDADADATSTSMSKAKKRAETLIQLQNVSARAVKNCPYSVPLFSVKMQGVMEEVQAGRKVLEPDDLMKIVNEATSGGFLPNQEAHLDIYLAACRLVKRRVMELVSKGTSSLNYDDSERLDTIAGGGMKKKRRRGEEIELKKFVAPLEDDLEQEVHDLTEDLRDMFEAGDGYLRKTFPEWTEGRYLFMREKARVEAFVCSPLLNDVNSDDVVKIYEKLLRVHQPPHPNAWRDYIQYMTGKSYVIQILEEEETEGDGAKMMEAPGMIVARFRFIRNMYQRALSSLKKVNRDESTPSDLAYDSALKLLCEEFVTFETYFGSEQSAITASKFMAKKLTSIRQKNDANVDVAVLVRGERDVGTLNDHAPKRRRDSDEIKQDDDDDGDVDRPSAKKSKVDKDEQVSDDNTHIDVAMEDAIEDAQKSSIDDTEKPSSDNNQKKKGPNIWPIKPKPEHMIKVGNMEYPVHPFTIHVTNLSSETIDGELYDLFRSKCGAIVHARIFREKGHAGPGHIPTSKCAGLVQFEERESVEKALELSGDFGLHEKLVVVSRSHQPAVAVVPPGTHWVKPKGEGKNSKRNIKQKERRAELGTKDGEHEKEVSKDIQQNSNKKANDAEENLAVVEPKEMPSVLSFRPRNVGQKQRKKKLGL